MLLIGSVIVRDCSAVLLI